jgi:threonyl-tRNA synthetase
VPFLLVVGDREVEQGVLAVRDRKGQDLGSLGVDAFIDMLTDAVANRN